MGSLTPTDDNEDPDQDPFDLLNEWYVYRTPQPIGDGYYALADDEERYEMLPDDGDDEETAARKRMEFLGYPDEAIEGALGTQEPANWHEELGVDEWVYSVFVPYELGYTLEGAERMVADGRFFSRRIATHIEKMRRPELYQIQDILCNTFADRLVTGNN